MISIILVNWNGHRDTIECLESLLRQHHDDFEVIVVDNGSTDGSIDALRAWAASPEAIKPVGTPWSAMPDQRGRSPVLTVVEDNTLDPVSERTLITVVSIGQNLGFAGGNNIGMNWALSNPKVTHIWLLNNDTVVQPDCLNQLEIAARSDLSIGFLGARLMHYHEPSVVQALGGQFNLFICRGSHIGYSTDEDLLPDQTNVNSKLDYIIGASIFASADFIRRIGPMYDRFFLYFEELEWSARMPPGYRLSACLDAVVYHKEGASIGTRGQGRPSDTSIYYLSVNLLRYVWRYHKFALPIAFARLSWEYIKYARLQDSDALHIIRLAVLDFARRNYRKGRISRTEGDP